MFDPFPKKKLLKILTKIIRLKSNKKNFLISFNPSPTIIKNKNLKLIKKIDRSTYSSFIFKIF